MYRSKCVAAAWQSPNSAPKCHTADLNASCFCVVKLLKNRDSTSRCERNLPTDTYCSFTLIVGFDTNVDLIAYRISWKLNPCLYGLVHVHGRGFSIYGSQKSTEHVTTNLQFVCGIKLLLLQKCFLVSNLYVLVNLKRTYRSINLCLSFFFFLVRVPRN